MRAAVTVLPAEANAEADRGQNWGDWDFSSLPRAGDHLQLERDGISDLLAVRRVIHYAVQHPVPRSETPYKQRKTPSICIVAIRSDP